MSLLDSDDPLTLLAVKRDGFTCKLCGIKQGEPYDQHVHAMPDGEPALLEVRIISESIPADGLVLGNCITVCASCEMELEDFADGDPECMQSYTAEALESFRPSNLYKLVNSSYESAWSEANNIR